MEPIQQDQEYTGVRVRLEARLGTARIPLQIDIGFGDAITPEAVEIEYPAMLAFPAPVLCAYPRETVVAEKFQALVMFGMATSRMKDLYDLWILARYFAFEGPTLCQAIRATFARRQTALPDSLPLVLSSAFAEDSAKRTQWQAFVRKNRLAGEGTDLSQVLSVLQDFLMPPVQALVAGEAFGKTWPASGLWRPVGNGA